MPTSPRQARRSRAPSGFLLAPELPAILRRAQAKQRAPSVGAAVFRGRELLWRGAVGWADVEARREATPDTRYPIASITKSFVAVAVMQLRDAGVLALDDPVRRHVPEAPAGPTIATLLSHASGLQREVPGERLGDPRVPEPRGDPRLARRGRARARGRRRVALLEPRLRAPRRGRGPAGGHADRE